MEKKTYLTVKLNLDTKSILNNTADNLLLKKIFQWYHYIIMSLGILPLKISSRDGQASCKLISWPSVYTGLCLFGFLFDSCLVIPMYTSLIQSTSKDSSTVACVAQVMSITCQYLGGAVSFILIPFTIPNFALFWNRVQKVTTSIARLTSNSEFEAPYAGARWNVSIWLFTSFSFSLFCIFSYVDYFDVFMGNDGGGLIYWIYFMAFCVFPFILSFHILQPVILITFSCVLKTCFIALRKYSDSLLKGRAEQQQKQSIGNAIALYNELNEIITELGEIGGIYVIIEVIIMIICVTMNLFFLISQFNEIKGSFVYLAVILPYLVWFHWICKSGHSLNIEAFKCLRSVKLIAFHQNVHSEKEYKDSTLIKENMMELSEWNLLENPVPLTAMGYFSINMRLFTTIIGTITTYLIVMVQFKVGSPAAADCHPESESKFNT